MEKLNGRIKYVIFLMGMMLVLVLCVGFIYVFAETGPTALETTGEPSPTATQSASEIVNTTSTATATPTVGNTTGQTTVSTTGNTTGQTNKTSMPTTATARTSAPTIAPTTGNTTSRTTQPTASYSQSPSNSASASITPTYTPILSQSEVTVAPMPSGDLLPTPAGAITSKSETYNKDLEKDLHGYTIYVVAPWDISVDGLTDTAAINAFKAKYNCNVEFLHLSKEVIFNRLLMSCATGETYFDAILVESATVLTDLEPMGMLEEFSKYLTQAEIDAISLNYRKFLGKEDRLYGIPATAPDFSGMWINESLISELKIVNPLTTYNSKNWTWNNVLGILYNSIGQKGEKYSYGLATSSYLVPPVLESMGNSLIRWNGSVFVSGAANKSTMTSLNFLKNIYVNNYIANSYESHFYLKESAYLAGEISMYPQFVEYLLNQKVTFVQYPTNTDGNNFISMASSAYCASIVKSSRYPAHTAELLKIIYGGDKFSKRVDKFCVDNGFNEQIKTVYRSMLNNFTIDFSQAFDKDGSIRNMIMSLLKNGTYTDEVSMSQLEPVILQMIQQRSKQINLSDIPVQIKW